MITPESDDEISDEDFTIVDSSSPAAGPLSSAEQRNRSFTSERSRSCERVFPRSSSHASQTIACYSSSTENTAESDNPE